MVSQKEINRINRGLDQKLAELERKFDVELKKFYNRYVKPLQTIMPAESIRKRHEAKIHNMIRQMVEEAYNVGTDLVGKEIKRKDPDFVKFTSQTDVRNISDKTNELENRFWYSIDKLTTRKNLFVQVQDKEGSHMEHAPELEEKAELGAMAAHLIYDAYNLGVRSKLYVVAQIGLRAIPALTAIGSQVTQSRPVPKIPTSIQKTQTNRILIKNTPAPAAPGGPTPGAGISDDFIPESSHLLKIRPLKAELMFLTKEDAKVDKKICAPLNRTIYDRDEPDIPTPPLHKWCRCTLVPLV